MRWCGAENRMGVSKGRQAWTDRSKREHDYVPQRERRQRKSHTDNQQHTHTHPQLMREMEQVIDQVEPVKFKKAATPTAQTHEGRTERKHTETKGVLCFKLHFTALLFSQGCTFRHRLEVMLGHSGLGFRFPCSQSAGTRTFIRDPPRPLLQPNPETFHLWSNL